MKNVLAMTAAILMLSACAVFGQAVDKIADGVEKYCEQPYVYRSDFRNTVNTALDGTGHTVHVHCAGDPDHEATLNFEFTGGTEMNAEQLTAFCEDLTAQIAEMRSVLLVSFPGCFDSDDEIQHAVEVDKERPPEQLVALFLANSVEEFGLELIRETLAAFDEDTSVAGLLEGFDKKEDGDNGNA